MDFRIKTDPDWAWLTNRNAHCVDLTEIRVTTVFDDNVVHIDGVTRSGRLLTGGISIDRLAFEQMIAAYQEQRRIQEYLKKIMEEK